MRDIDRRVATEVMEWIHDTDSGEWLDSPGYCDNAWDWAEADKSGLIEWRPSTRVDHAWEVVGKLTQDYDIEIAFDGEVWWCALDKRNFLPRHPDNDEHDGYAEAATAPLAICKAAMEVVK